LEGHSGDKWNRHNWARNVEYSANRLIEPETIADLRAAVLESASIKALGTRHSFSCLADTRGTLVSLGRLNQIDSLDPDRRTVTVGGGIRYGDLAIELHRRGWAIHNLASLPHISVAGAISTATHGSGDRNGNLSTAVTALEFVDGRGEVVTVSRESGGDEFQGLVVGLGGYGLITKVNLEIIPAFEMRQSVYENLPADVLYQNFDAVTGAAYSVSLFTDWRAGRFTQVWLKSVAGGDRPVDGKEFFGALAASGNRHPIGSLSPVACTDQMGTAGPWFDRLPHFKLDNVPSAGDELQTEYFVPRRFAVAALKAIFALADRIEPLLLVSEIRTMAADNLWMSPAFERDAVGIHFTWKNRWETPRPAVRDMLPVIEQALAPFEARPHWAKLSTMRPEYIRALYPKSGQFRSLLLKYDPEGKFRNSFLDSCIFS
jgi:xylitol oxidase